MLFHLTAIFACQLLGELVVAFFKLPLPGPVFGMALLFCALLLRGEEPEELGAVADALLGAFSLLFVPAGVGVMLHVGLIGRDWAPITVGLLVSTALAMVVSGYMMAWFNQRRAEDAA